MRFYCCYYCCYFYDYVSATLSKRMNGFVDLLVNGDYELFGDVVPFLLFGGDCCC